MLSELLSAISEAWYFKLFLSQRLNLCHHPKHGVYIKRDQSFILLTCKLALFVLKDIDFVITPEIAPENPKNTLLNWNPDIESCRNVAVGALWWALPSSDTHKKRWNVCKNKPNPSYNYFWNLLAMTGKPIKYLRHSSVVIVWWHSSAKSSFGLLRHARRSMQIKTIQVFFSV